MPEIHGLKFMVGTSSAGHQDHFPEYTIETGTVAESTIQALAGTRAALGAGSKGGGGALGPALEAELGDRRDIGGANETWY
ncbi:MAG: hypothetical protein IIA34_04710 [Proteobacteria bacterium]|nr:hypothetical protein [Pseudomonadota bacterium]MCH8000942.1 hypothetical protein [Pseudomonadota bacterium]